MNENKKNTIGDGNWRDSQDVKNTTTYVKNQNGSHRHSQKIRKTAPSPVLQNPNQFNYDPIKENFRRSLNATQDCDSWSCLNAPCFPPPPTAYASPYYCTTTLPSLTPPCTPPQGFGQCISSARKSSNPVQGQGQGAFHFHPPPSRGNCGCCAGECAIVCIPRDGCLPSGISSIRHGSRPNSQPLEDTLEKTTSFNNCNFYCSGISELPTLTSHYGSLAPSKFSKCSRHDYRDFGSGSGEFLHTSGHFKCGINIHNENDYRREHRHKSKRSSGASVGRSVYKILKRKSPQFCGVGEKVISCHNHHHHHLSPYPLQNNGDVSCRNSENTNAIGSSSERRRNLNPNGNFCHKEAMKNRFRYDTEQIRENYSDNSSEEYTDDENSVPTFTLAKHVLPTTPATQWTAFNKSLKSRCRRFKLRNGKSRMFARHPSNSELGNGNNDKVNAIRTSTQSNEPESLEVHGSPHLCLLKMEHCTMQNQNENKNYCFNENFQRFEKGNSEATILPPPTAFAATLCKSYLDNVEIKTHHMLPSQGNVNVEKIARDETPTNVGCKCSNSHANIQAKPCVNSTSGAVTVAHILGSDSKTYNRNPDSIKRNADTTSTCIEEPETRRAISSERESEPDYPAERFDYMSEKNLSVISTLDLRRAVGHADSNGRSREESPEKYTGTSKLTISSSARCKIPSNLALAYPVIDCLGNSIWRKDLQAISIGDAHYGPQHRDCTTYGISSSEHFKRTKSNRKNEFNIEGEEINDSQSQEISMRTDCTGDKRKSGSICKTPASSHLAQNNEYVVMHSFVCPKAVMLQKCGEEESRGIVLIERKNRRKQTASSNGRISCCSCRKPNIIFVRKVDEVDVCVPDSFISCRRGPIKVQAHPRNCSYPNQQFPSPQTTFSGEQMYEPYSVHENATMRNPRDPSAGQDRVNLSPCPTDGYTPVNQPSLHGIPVHTPSCHKTLCSTGQTQTDNSLCTVPTSSQYPDQLRHRTPPFCCDPYRSIRPSSWNSRPPRWPGPFAPYPGACRRPSSPGHDRYSSCDPFLHYQRCIHKSPIRGPHGFRVGKPDPDRPEESYAFQTSAANRTTATSEIPVIADAQRKPLTPAQFISAMPEERRAPGILLPSLSSSAIPSPQPDKSLSQFPKSLESPVSSTASLMPIKEKDTSNNRYVEEPQVQEEHSSPFLAKKAVSEEVEHNILTAVVSTTSGSNEVTHVLAEVSTTTRRNKLPQRHEDKPTVPSRRKGSNEREEDDPSSGRRKESPKRKEDDSTSKRRNGSHERKEDGSTSGRRKGSHERKKDDSTSTRKNGAHEWEEDASTSTIQNGDQVQQKDPSPSVIQEAPQGQHQNVPSPLLNDLTAHNTDPYTQPSCSPCCCCNLPFDPCCCQTCDPCCLPPFFDPCCFGTFDQFSCAPCNKCCSSSIPRRCLNKKRVKAKKPIQKWNASTKVVNPQSKTPKGITSKARGCCNFNAINRGCAQSENIYPNNMIINPYQLMFPSILSMDHEQPGCQSHPPGMSCPTIVNSTCSEFPAQATSGYQDIHSSIQTQPVSQLFHPQLATTPNLPSQAQPTFVQQMLTNLFALQLAGSATPEMMFTAPQSLSQFGCKDMTSTMTMPIPCKAAKSNTSNSSKQRGCCKRRVNGGRK